ncbi:hypothetical protein N7495_000009 [Penicillium taxi]|uniref:uncharacterized protein n=1 Tax=Penicillium taxi TaxID=168475 RepID=UPI0025458C37|nr:uncharacterized protein N7495_000009 [Penicillium taxi]KAJ5907327.1 hypothetical protein N7495_000009 [Penicillium taxi]
MDALDKNSLQASGLPLAFYGTVIHSRSLESLEILEKCFLLVDISGRIQELQSGVDPSQINTIISDLGYTPDVFPVKYLEHGKFLCPGFVDTHNHAPQWAQRGVGRGKALLDWLNEVTFAHEAKFADSEYAERMYTSCVTGLLSQGITTASYYASLHGKATQILANICLDKGQRALIGKCNMNRNSPDWYRDESVEGSLHETRELIQHIQNIDPESQLLKAILTPRFAISCEPDLLSGLGVISQEYPDLPIQTHFNEAQQEMSFTRQLFPEFRTETELYKHFGLLNERSILAHCIFLEEQEMQTIEDLRCGVAHCPISNTTMDAFMVAPIREYLRRGIKVGLGTDCGGGHAISMLECMKQAFVVSNARQMLTQGQDPALSLPEGKTGNFAIGKEFDALEVHTVDLEGAMTPVEEEDSISVIFEKWIMTGDDRNIAKVYVRGRSVKL